jgi:hypothetical protein
MQFDLAGVKSLYVEAAFCTVDINNVLDLCIDKQITVKDGEAETFPNIFHNAQYYLACTYCFVSLAGSDRCFKTVRAV